MTRLGELFGHLKVDAREVFGGDIPELLLAEQYDLALAPMTAYPRGLHHRTLRREPLRLAVNEDDPLARRKRIELATLRRRRFEVWPREMAPGFYDTVIGACRSAGFEPDLDEHAAGNTVWGYIASGRGVALINSSLIEQLPRGIALVDLAPSTSVLTIDAVWHHRETPVINGSSKQGRSWRPSTIGSSPTRWARQCRCYRRLTTGPQRYRVERRRPDRPYSGTFPLPDGTPSSSGSGRPIQNPCA